MIIELRHVSYSIPKPDGGRQQILDDVSFHIDEGTITCIMGVSGSGKTTLLRLMAGLVRPDEGEVLVFGRDVAKYKERDLNEIRREMGFVFQYSALFDSLSVAQNIAFGLQRRRRPRREQEEVVTRLLDEIGLPGIEDKRPSELSGGMKKRVAMARALATNPKIVLYDEPDSGLDPVMTRVIGDLIVKMRDTKQTTNVVVTHNVPAIWAIADRVMMLHGAVIVADGTPDEVEMSPHPVVQQFVAGRADGPITA